MENLECITVAGEDGASLTPMSQAISNVWWRKYCGEVAPRMTKPPEVFETKSGTMLFDLLKKVESEAGTEADLVRVEAEYCRAVFRQSSSTPPKYEKDKKISIGESLWPTIAIFTTAETFGNDEAGRKKYHTVCAKKLKSCPEYIQGVALMNDGVKSRLEGSAEGDPGRELTYREKVEEIVKGNIRPPKKNPKYKAYFLEDVRDNAELKLNVDVKLAASLRIDAVPEYKNSNETHNQGMAQKLTSMVNLYAVMKCSNKVGKEFFPVCQNAEGWRQLSAVLGVDAKAIPTAPRKRLPRAKFCSVPFYRNRKKEIVGFHDRKKNASYVFGDAKPKRYDSKEIRGLKLKEEELIVPPACWLGLASDDLLSPVDASQVEFKMSREPLESVKVKPESAGAKKRNRKPKTEKKVVPGRIDMGSDDDELVSSGTETDDELPLVRVRKRNRKPTSDEKVVPGGIAMGLDDDELVSSSTDSDDDDDVAGGVAGEDAPFEDVGKPSKQEAALIDAAPDAAKEGTGETSAESEDDAEIEAAGFNPEYGSDLGRKAGREAERKAGREQLGIDMGDEEDIVQSELFRPPVYVDQIIQQKFEEEQQKSSEEKKARKTKKGKGRRRKGGSKKSKRTPEEAATDKGEGGKDVVDQGSASEVEDESATPFWG